MTGPETEDAPGGADPLGLTGPDGPAHYREYVRRIAPCLRGFGLSEKERKDIAHGAILQTIDAVKGPDPARDPVPYMKRVARNLAVDLFRERFGRGKELPWGAATELEELQGQRQEAADGRDEYRDPQLRESEDSDLWDLVHPVIGGMRGQKREVLARQSRGEPDEVIAQELGISKGQLHTQRSTGLKKVREQPEVRAHIRQGYLKDSQKGGKRSSHLVSLR